MDAQTLGPDVGSIRTIAEALDWARSRTPPAAFLDAVAQDEFTHDVVVRVGPGCFVVFDTT